MEQRRYFVFGDLLACTATGAAAAWVTQAIVPGDWFIPVGMMLGMILGMLVGTVAGILFTPLFGSMEVMLPVALSGMLAGSVSGMLGAMTGTGTLLWSGAAAGLVCLAYTWLLQARLHGEAG